MSSNTSDSEGTSSSLSNTTTAAPTAAPPTSSFTYRYVLSDEPASPSHGTTDLRSRFRKTGGSAKRPVAGAVADGKKGGEVGAGQGQPGGGLEASCVIQ